MKAEKIRSRRASPAEEVAELTAKRDKVREGNYGVLGRLCAQRRAKEGLSLRDVARETSISATTLSRMENGITTPDAKHLVSLSRWLGIGLEKICDPVIEDVPEQVQALVLADPKLDKEQREALCEMFSVIYRQMTRQS